MLKEMSSWAVSQYQAYNANDLEIPSEYTSTLQNLLDCPGQFLNWGGRIDIQPLIVDERSFDSVAAFVAVELSA